MLMTDEERARLLDLRYRIRRGDYDLDRVPDTWVYRLSVFLNSHAVALIIYALAWGFGLALIALALLVEFGG